MNVHPAQSIYLSIHPSIHLSICLWLYIYIYTCMYLFMFETSKFGFIEGLDFVHHLYCPGCLRQLLCQGNLLCQDLGPSQGVQDFFHPYDQQLGWKMIANHSIVVNWPTIELYRLKKQQKNMRINKHHWHKKNRVLGFWRWQLWKVHCQLKKTTCSSHVWDFVRSHVHGIDDRRLRGLWQEETTGHWIGASAWRSFSTLW